MFDRKSFDAACSIVCGKFEKTSPTASDWADWLYRAKDAEVTLADIQLLQRLSSEDTPANYAANLVYHLQESLGRDTTGHAGF